MHLRQKTMCHLVQESRYYHRDGTQFRLQAYKLFRRVILLLFIIFELIAQGYLVFHFYKLKDKLEKFHKKNTFIKIYKNNSQISTNNVINTNNCHLSVCKTQFKNKIIILSAIDNLIKGGAGQAIQNMNLRFNFKEVEGLR